MPVAPYIPAYLSDQKLQSIELKHLSINSDDGPEYFSPHRGEISMLCSFPNGYHFLSGSTDGSLRIWDRQERCIRVLEGEDSTQISCVNISECGRRALSGHRSPKNEVKIWDIETSGVCRTFVGHKASISSAHFLPHELGADRGKIPKKVLSASFDGTLRIWDIKSGVNERTLGGLPPISDLSLYSEKRVLIGSTDGGIRIIDLETAKCVRRFNAESAIPITQVAIKDEKQFFSTSADGLVQLWDIREPFPIKGSLIGCKGDEIHLACCPFNLDLVVLRHRPNKSYLWDTSSSVVFAFPEAKKEWSNTPLAFSPKGEAAAFGVGNKIECLSRRELASLIDE